MRIFFLTNTQGKLPRMNLHEIHAKFHANSTHGKRQAYEYYTKNTGDSHANFTTFHAIFVRLSRAINYTRFLFAKFTIHHVIIA